MKLQKEKNNSKIETKMIPNRKIIKQERQRMRQKKTNKKQIKKEKKCKLKAMILNLK